ncbi:MAG: sigma-70 family RNA polymerase sigma factor [Acidobacteria bacterium]|nr:sigma-70 family RNA polymerase sigma factor [Acidobacteriota bacterium]
MFQPVQMSGPETAWVDRIRAGDRGAEELLVRFFQPRVHAFARRNLHDPIQTEELVQDTLWAAIRAAREGRIDDPANLPGFIYGIARRRVADAVRKSARDPHVRWPEDFDPPALHDERQAGREREAVAADAISTLEPADRGILNMCLIEGLETSEIAQRLQMRPDAVRQRKSRALKRIIDRIREMTSHPAPAGRLNHKGDYPK